MKPPNWDRLQDIYHAALARPRTERSAFVAKACAGDPDLAREVNQLIKAADSSGGILENPIMEIDPASENLVGIIIAGRYLVERPLPRGGMSQVYFARDLNLDRKPVVIKFLSDPLVQDSYARRKFAQEVEALLRLDRHPGVVRVSDRGELADGRPYIVMDYVEGETLRSQIPREGMDLTRAASILKQTGEALEHVNARGIFHRDLKPENIILTRSTDAVVLIDFGIAKVNDSEVAPSTVNGSLAGTVLYMSPEQLRGEEIAAASDVYSMAVIAYEVVTGRRPFNPSSASQMLELERTGVKVKPMSLRPDLPRKAQDIILRGLSFRPMARYKSAKQFGDELANALLEPFVPAPYRQRLKFVWILLIIMLSLAALSYGLYKYLDRRSDPTTSKGFNYWLMVQKMRDGKEYQTPFKSNGEGIFENGDKFQLNVFSLESGYLYIFNEGPPEPDSVSFRMIYPNKATNNSSASIGAKQTVQSDWITFRGPAGAENFWIVWSVTPVTELETAKNGALAHPEAGLIGENLVNVKQVLKTMDVKINARAARYEARQEATVRSKTDIVLTLAQFQHR